MSLWESVDRFFGPILSPDTEAMAVVEWHSPFSDTPVDDYFSHDYSTPVVDTFD